MSANRATSVVKTAIIVGDIGNTFARFARVMHASYPDAATESPPRETRWTPAFAPSVRVPTPELDADAFRRIVAEIGVADAIWRIASVQRDASRLLADWQWDDASCLQLVSHCDFPMPTAVDHPECVGVDRLAAAHAAGRLKEPAAAAVVVDAGTAITVDAVSVDRTFLGGTISPGLLMSLQALHRHASQLPRMEGPVGAGRRSVIGRNTEEAMASGVWWGCVGAVREIVRRTVRELGGETQVFVTGGDGARLAEHLPWTTLVVPDLVWRGLLW